MPCIFQILGVLYEIPIFQRALHVSWSQSNSSYSFHEISCLDSDRPWTHFGHEESLGEEHDLADLLQVGDDHDDRSEQRLDGLRQLGTTGVSRVHRDEDAHAVVHEDLLPFKLHNDIVCNMQHSLGSVESNTLDIFWRLRLRQHFLRLITIENFTPRIIRKSGSNGWQGHGGTKLGYRRSLQHCAVCTILHHFNSSQALLYPNHFPLTGKS